MLKYFSCKGRDNRTVFFFIQCILFTIVFFLSLPIYILLTPNLANSIITVVTLMFLPISIPSYIRRLHDIGKSGWWMLIVPIPIIGFVFYVYLFFKAGQNGKNKYDTL